MHSEPWRRQILQLWQSPPSSLLSLAVWTNAVLKQWKCCHISLQIQVFSISSYAIDGDSQSILLPLDSTENKGAQPFAGQALCHSVTCFFNSSLSTMAALCLSHLFVPMQKSCPNLDEKGCSMQRQIIDSNIFENKAILGSVHSHIYHHSSPFL